MAESDQTPNYKPDNKSSVYDQPGSAQSTPSNGLNHQEGSIGAGASSTASPLSSGSLKNAESSGGFYKKSLGNGSGVKDKVAMAAGGEATIVKKATQVVVGALSKHKTGVAAGGGVVALLVLLVILGSGFLVSHELVTMEKTLLGYEAKIEQKFEKKAASKLMQKLICIRNKNCKPTAEPSDPDENADPAADAPGEELTAEMDTVAADLSSPTVVADLAKVGITESTAGGGLTLKDSSGANVTEDISSDVDGTGDLLETAIPEFEEGQVQSFGPEMTLHAGVTEDPITSENEDDPTKAVESDILDGADNAQIVADAEVVDNQAPDKNASTSDKAEYNGGANDAGALSEEIDATDKAIAAGESSADAIAAGEAAAGPTVAGSLLVSSAASEVCSIDKVATDAAKSRVPKIVTLLIRHGALVLSLADELKAGALKGGVVNKVMGLFNGNPSAPPSVDAKTGKAVPSQDTLPFSASEEYQKASGGSGGVPIDGSSLPTANAGTAVVNDVNSTLKDSVFGEATCKIENSPFGFIANGLAGAVQLIGDVGSFGALQAVETAGLIGLQQVIQRVVIPDILKYFTPVGLDGLENSAQLGNNAGLGMNLASDDYARSEGANPVPSTTANTLADEATQAQNIANSRLSWVNRTFALSNTDSLASRLITHVPLGLSATINGAMSYLLSIPSSLLHNISIIFSSRVAALTPTTAPGVSDGVTQYAFTDSDLDKYDPLLNEQYLFSNVTYKGVSMQRIAMLGNPNTATVNTSGDEIDSTGALVTSDLLHCYIDGFTDLQEAQSTSPGTGIDTNCYVANVYALGSYDYDDSTPASPAQIDSALDNTIVGVYCAAFANNPSVTHYSSSSCHSVISGQIQDDIGHFRQYILDVHVMKDYTSLITTQ